MRACVCGSDLWWYRGIANREHGSLVGHEAIGIVEEVGSDVKDVKPGDFVIAPFTHGCGHCAACLAGFDGNCMNQEAGATVVTKVNIYGLLMLTGHSLKFLVSHLTTLMTS